MRLRDKYYNWMKRRETHIAKLPEIYATKYAAVYLAKPKHNKN